MHFSVILLATTFLEAASAIVNQALWDGACYYPIADPNFPDDLSKYMGRWYQVAGTVVPFTLECTCIYAQYSLNKDKTVKVTNACQRGQQSSKIDGTIVSVDEAYGTKGTFQVSFSSVPGGGVYCPGPNYIVQKYDPNWAIVQGPNFTSLFVLSRAQHPKDSDIENYLHKAASLGADLSLVTKFSQSGCLFT